MKGRALLAWNLRALRTAKSLSQERLAIDAGVDRAWVSKLELEQGNASLDLLDRLAEALEVPIDTLFAEPKTDAERPQPLRKGRRRRE